MKKSTFLFLFYMFSTSLLMAQTVGINNSGAIPDASAILDVQSTTQGLLVPRMDSTQRKNIVLPAEGLLVFDIDTGSFWFRNGGNWVNVASPKVLADQDGDTKIHVEETTDDDQIRFDIKGEERFVIQENAFGETMLNAKTVRFNTFFGNEAGLNTDGSVYPDGHWNTFFGNLAGKANNSGSYNSYFGDKAGRQNQTGDGNTYIGASAGQNLIDGGRNTLLGFFSGEAMTSGDRNTFVGSSSGALRTGGSNNTFVGYNAGRINSTGSGNIMLGCYAGSGYNGNNKLFIENSSSGAPLIYGDFDSNLLRSNGKFEINTTSVTSPFKISINGSQKLDMDATGQLRLGTTASTTSRVHIESEINEDALKVRVNGVTKLYVHSNGGIRNNASTPTFAFQLQNSSSDIQGRGQAYSWNTYSDRRIKSNFRIINYGLQTIMQLRPQSYDHHNSEYFEDGQIVLKGETSTNDIGLIAQDVYEIIPEAVTPPAHENELWSMDYTRLVPVLIMAVQEQQETIYTLTTKNNELELQLNELHQLNAEVQEIKAALLLRDK